MFAFPVERNRRYTVYAEVRKQVRMQSSFAQRELDFSQSVQELLAKLDQEIELSSKRGPLDTNIRQRAPGPSEPLESLGRTPGPDD